MKVSKNKYNELLDNISLTIEQARKNAFKAINTELVKANWEDSHNFTLHFFYENEIFVPVFYSGYNNGIDGCIGVL